MSIDAHVAYVECHEDGSGVLHLIDRVAEKSEGNSGVSEGNIRRRDGIAGQPRLRFATAPYEVTALNGLPIWGGSSSIMLGEREIARREGYTRIWFIEREPFLAAVAEYHQRHLGSADG